MQQLLGKFWKVKSWALITVFIQRQIYAWFLSTALYYQGSWQIYTLGCENFVRVHTHLANFDSGPGFHTRKYPLTPHPGDGIPWRHHFYLILFIGWDIEGLTFDLRIIFSEKLYKYRSVHKFPTFC